MAAARRRAQAARAAAEADARLLAHRRRRRHTGGRRRTAGGRAAPEAAAHRTWEARRARYGAAPPCAFSRKGTRQRNAEAPARSKARRRMHGSDMRAARR